MLDLLISPAYAQQAATPPSLLGSMWPLLVMIPLFYFMLIRPQMKRSREHRDMLAQISKGDEVVTTGGLAGKVANIGEAYVSVEIADNVLIKVQKQAIASVLPKGTLKSL